MPPVIDQHRTDVSLAMKPPIWLSPRFNTTVMVWLSCHVVREEVGHCEAGAVRTLSQGNGIKAKLAEL